MCQFIFYLAIIFPITENIFSYRMNNSSEKYVVLIHARKYCATHSLFYSKHMIQGFNNYKFCPPTIIERNTGLS